MASGVVDKTSLFLNPGKGSDNISINDVFDSAKSVYQKLSDSQNGILQLDKLSDRCYKEYLELIKIQKKYRNENGITMMFRFFLNTSSGTLGRTYGSLTDIELAKVQLVDSDKIRIVSIISQDHLDECLKRSGLLSIGIVFS